MDERIAANRANWDDRTPIHLASDFYDIEGWLVRGDGPPAREVAALGDVEGLDLVHLQCHIGTDTIAWARLGARVTGLDLSPAAVAAARDLAERAGVAERARFVEGDVLEAAAVLAPDTFDIVYVSLGALCWLPSAAAWAEQVAALLRPGGRVYLHDVHPLAWSFDEDGERIIDTGFEEPEPYVDDSDVTYTDGDGRLARTRSYQWNHSIGEVVTALIDRGLVLDALTEHDDIPFPRFPWLIESGRGVWTIPPDRPRMPLTFSLLAHRPERRAPEQAEELRGERVVLRPPQPDDVDALVAIRVQPEVRRWWRGGDDMAAAIAEDLAEEQSTPYVIELDGRVVGWIQWDEETEPDYRRAEMDIYVDPAVRGQGVGPDALRTLARHIIDDHAHHRIEIGPAADNEAAVRAYAKVGFRPVGLLRQAERDEDGTWHDSLIMDLLSEDLT